VKLEKGVRIIPNGALYVDVALVLDGEVRVVWYNITIVNLHPTHNVLPPIIGAMVDGVTLFIHCGSILKWPWILLCASVFLVIAGRSRVLVTTWSMNHDLLYYFEKLRLCLGIWPVRTDAGIDSIHRVELMLLLEENEEMHMWESSLLEFDGIYFCDWPTKNAILHDIVKEGFLFQPKHPSNEVRAIRGFLSRKQLPLDLWPVRICRHRNEEIDFFEVSSDRHRILENPVHVSSTSDIRGW